MKFSRAQSIAFSTAELANLVIIEAASVFKKLLQYTWYKTSSNSVVKTRMLPNVGGLRYTLRLLEPEGRRCKAGDSFLLVSNTGLQPKS